MNSDGAKTDEAREGLDAEHWRRILREQPLRFDVVSGSMAPTFRTGEKVLIRPLKDGEPKRGQILAYSRGVLVTHRYVGHGICHGDNLFEKDPAISTDDMVGIVTAVERGGHLFSLSSRLPIRIRIRTVIRNVRRVWFNVRTKRTW